MFVNRRPKHEILDVLRGRIDNPTDAELATALDELVAIAEDRWRRAQEEQVSVWEVRHLTDPVAGKSGCRNEVRHSPTRCPTSVGHPLS